MYFPVHLSTVPLNSWLQKRMKVLQAAIMKRYIWISYIHTCNACPYIPTYPSTCIHTYLPFYLPTYIDAYRKDDRMARISEVLYGVRIIKLFVWEPQFAAVIGR